MTLHNKEQHWWVNKHWYCFHKPFSYFWLRAYEVIYKIFTSEFSFMIGKFWYDGIMSLVCHLDFSMSVYWCDPCFISSPLFILTDLWLHYFVKSVKQMKMVTKKLCCYLQLINTTNLLDLKNRNNPESYYGFKGSKLQTYWTRTLMEIFIS